MDKRAAKTVSPFNLIINISQNGTKKSTTQAG